MNSTWGPSCERTCSDSCFNRWCNSSSGECLSCIPTLFGPQCTKGMIIYITLRQDFILPYGIGYIIIRFSFAVILYFAKFALTIDSAISFTA